MTEESAWSKNIIVVLLLKKIICDVFWEIDFHHCFSIEIEFQQYKNEYKHLLHVFKNLVQFADSFKNCILFDQCDERKYYFKKVTNKSLIEVSKFQKKSHFFDKLWSLSFQNCLNLLWIHTNALFSFNDEVKILNEASFELALVNVNL